MAKDDEKQFERLEKSVSGLIGQQGKETIEIQKTFAQKIVGGVGTKALLKELKQNRAEEAQQREKLLNRITALKTDRKS